MEKKKLANKDEEELRRLSVELRYLEQTAEAIQSRLNMINAVATDLTYANMALDGLENEKENTELLVPVGGNSYVKAKLENPDKLIVGVGAGVSVEKTLAESRDIIKKRLDDLGKAKLSLQQQFSQVVDKANEDRERVERLMAKMREGNAPQNV
ncbi:prefoldin subunit alpha [Candidatus Bathyarchaeota archaeon]|nr:prefoldin subunit alpha [Candidatus Bathyarchaeota archaeon]